MPAHAARATRGVPAGWHVPGSGRGTGQCVTRVAWEVAPGGVGRSERRRLVLYWSREGRRGTWHVPHRKYHVPHRYVTCRTAAVPPAVRLLLPHRAWRTLS